MTREINLKVTVEASIEDVWSAWTTEEGITGFFSKACNIELRPGGAYEPLFNLTAEKGMQGAEGMIILALQEPEMLSFTWNAPPHIPLVRGQMTHVTVRLRDMGNGRTEVHLNHDGWGSGGQWDEAFDYFTNAWGNGVLPNLVRYFQK